MSNLTKREREVLSQIGKPGADNYSFKEARNAKKPGPLHRLAKAMDLRVLTVSVVVLGAATVELASGYAEDAERGVVSKFVYGDNSLAVQLREAQEMSAEENRKFFSMNMANGDVEDPQVEWFNEKKIFTPGVRAILEANGIEYTKYDGYKRTGKLPALEGFLAVDTVKEMILQAAVLSNGSIQTAVATMDHALEGYAKGRKHCVEGEKTPNPDGSYQACISYNFSISEGMRGPWMAVDVKNQFVQIADATKVHFYGAGSKVADHVIEALNKSEDDPSAQVVDAVYKPGYP